LIVAAGPFVDAILKDLYGLNLEIGMVDDLLKANIVKKHELYQREARESGKSGGVYDVLSPPIKRAEAESRETFLPEFSWRRKQQTTPTL
jgi:hypothetical protein